MKDKPKNRLRNELFFKAVKIIRRYIMLNKYTVNFLFIFAMLILTFFNAAYAQSDDETAIKKRAMESRL